MNFMTGAANIGGGGGRLGGGLPLAEQVLGVVPVAGMKSGEIRSDYVINRLRLQEMPIRTGCRVESRKDKV